ncbi:DUF1033 family protein [Rummeliibacillus sp. JY-2-4R]
MYKVIYMKADYEPWWEFDGWEKNIVNENVFNNKEEAKQFLSETLEKFNQKYMHHEHKKDRFWAFWSDEEVQFCEACDEDIQTYHGIIWEEIK